MTNPTTNLQNAVNNALQEVLNTNQKSGILLWNNLNLPNSFILKKDGKKYLGLPRKDRKGGDYWKFKEIKGKKSNSPESSPVVDQVEQLNQRQEKTRDCANNSHANKE